MKQFYFVLVFVIPVLSYSQNNKTSLTCNPTLVGTTNPTAFGLCDGTMTISLVGCPSPPYVIQWLNTGCVAVPLAESSFMGTTYTVNTLCGCSSQYLVLIENSTGEQSSLQFPILNPAPTGIVELNNGTAISIAPNPAQDVLNIDRKKLDMNDVRLDISNTLGQVVLSASLTIENQAVNIQLLPNGVYLARLYSDDKHIGFKKIVVQR